METQPKKLSLRQMLVFVALAGLVMVVAKRILDPIPTDEIRLEPPRLRLSPGVAADYNWNLVHLDERPVRFEQFQGKPVFLNIWATWCHPCMVEMPSIASLARQQQVQDVEFVCVAVDREVGPVRTVVDEQSYFKDLTILHSSPHELPASFQTSGIPATFLIAPDGRIMARHVGAAQWDAPEVVAAVASLARMSTEAEADISTRAAIDPEQESE